MKIIETEMQARQELVQWGKELYTQGLVKGSGGNLSIRLPDGRILFTPTGFLLGHMTEECLSLCDENGVLLSGEKPTKEVPAPYGSIPYPPQMFKLSATLILFTPLPMPAWQR